MSRFGAFEPLVVAWESNALTTDSFLGTMCAMALGAGR